MSTGGGHHLKIALGDTVKVKLKDDSKNKRNQNIGTIHFYGAVEGHKGTWFGISFASSIGKNNGTYKKRKYFECKPKHGLFIQHPQIIKIITKARYKHNIRIHCNSSITLPGFGAGKVRFAGIVSFHSGIWYGIQLETPASDANHIHSTNAIISPDTSEGTVSGVRYFECAAGYAAFQRKQDLYALLLGKTEIVTEKNIKPSLAERAKAHSNTAHDRSNRKHIKHKPKPPRIQKSISEPYAGNTPSASNSEEEIQDNEHNDHSNETKDEDETQTYGYDMDGDDDVDEKKTQTEDRMHKQHHRPPMLIAESSTSDLDDNIASGEEEKLKAPKIKKMIKSKSVPPRRKPRSESEPQPRSIYAKNLNVSAYINHLNDVATQQSPTTYNRPHSKSIKQLKTAFKEACTSPKHKRGKTAAKADDDPQVQSPCDKLKINVSSDKDHELHLPWKEYSTPVRFGSLSLEYSDDMEPDSPPSVSDAPPNGNTALVPEWSKSMPFGPTKATTNPPPPIDMSQSARNSLSNLDRDRALTFPTMALNTDDATKISAATPNQQTFKVVLIGKSRVGKTSIIRRFVKDKFHSSYKMTLGAAQWHFKCEVPIDLIEEIETDTNLINMNTSFLDQVQEENEDMIQEEPMTAMGVMQNMDPFDAEDEMAEFGATYDYDYGSVENDDYKLNNMDNIFDWRGGNVAKKDSAHSHHGSKSITDYGQFTVPEINTITKDTRKVSMKLQISLDIVDMGFHPTEEEVLEDINAIILVVDVTKKGSISDAIDKYETFCNNSRYFSPKAKRKSRRGRRSRARSHSNPRGSAKPEIEREYIPLIIAVNKCEMKKSKKQFKRRDIKRIIKKKLDPIIAEHFPEPEDEYELNDANDDDENNSDDDNENNQSGGKRRTRNFPNTTLLAPPNLSFIYNEDENENDSEYESEDENVTEDDEDEENKGGSDLLQVAQIFHNTMPSDPGDPFNTPRNPNAVKRRKKKSAKPKKKKEKTKSDIRYIDIIQCSAKSGKNIEKLFGTCIKKTIPSKLTKDVAHKRTKTTAHVTAPIWLRQVVAEFEKEPANENHPFWDVTPHVSDVDDNFTFLGSDHSDID